MAARIYLVFLFLLVFSNLSSALYEDQVGLADWHQRYIGKTKQAVFHSHKTGRKRVIVSTEENVIASLDLRTGEIFWRHVLEQNDSVNHVDIAHGKYVVTLSSEGSVLRAWNLPDGQLIWESVLQFSASSRPLLYVPRNSGLEKDAMIFVTGGGWLHAISSIDGEIIWKKELSTEREDALASVIDSTTFELPVEKDGVSVAKVEHNLFEWLKGHMLKLKGTLMLATPADIAAIQQMRLKSSQKAKMTRDHNGFRKLIIVLTKAGKLFALHTGDGHVVWSLLLPSLRVSHGCECLSALKLLQWQVPHHHALEENPSVLVVAKCGLSDHASAGIIKGYSVQGKCKSDMKDVYCFGTRELWSIVFPSHSEKLATIASRKMNEVVHTQAKVIADQDVMYKFISKNLLFVSTVAPKAAEGIGLVTPDEAWDNNNVLKLALGKHNLTSPISSYSRPDVVVKSQSYFFTHSVKAMTVTTTAKGITSKQLLVGTIADQVLALDKRYLDPRRSAEPTQSEKEEGMIPLTDSLPTIPQSYVTHSLQVEGLRGIVTFPH
ncbi:hypothetical protein HPP92_003925 [Vanilla planifolia]|uniref:ER membrane protein complex subunit 1 n=1 Tax=Vanilla planifolia TaxID=51239 RepID=A0A835RW03_VANPL|nr:hypothetical protein HPP92_003925 [Vanilla planifolia]